MKKTFAIMLSAVLAMGLLAGCGSNEETTTQTPETENTTGTTTEQAALADGNYFAKGEADDKGWMYMIQLDVNGGKIESVDFDAANINTAGKTKKELSESGEYGMKAGGASSEWHEQAALLEQALVGQSDTSSITLNEEGNTDAVSGVSIKANNFVELADKALAAGPVEQGAFKDGSYHAEQADFDEQGWKYTVDVTVFDGKIVAANWDAVNKDGGETKKEQSIAGTYGMNWHEQAQKMEADLIEKQDPAAIVIKEDGTQDAISGVSINVGEFVSLATEALNNAK